ncbi:DUF1329 domain-containing protein [Nevskia soli]|uniref:DUF1329 domain-containing protein n=1 Tax=Nevskia soli TaxID=418856 RepID=UPI0004A76230|nr:DUF1329 domain-containing protein [Nevskia soli]
MRIKKYDFNYGRRALMEKAAKGVFATGVLTPLWPLIARGDNLAKAYPDELVSIEAYTKGKVKPGDAITADNVDVVKDLLDPIAYQQVKTMGRRIIIVPPTTDITKMFNHDFLEATLKNKGKSKFDATGNVVYEDGGPWRGGTPFPDPKDGKEALFNITLSWGRHDYSLYAIRDWDIQPSGDEAYHYDFVWAELNTTARADGQVFNGMKDMLRLQSVWFTSPQDTAGTSFLSQWYYDQRKFPELYGYLPAFKRVRQFPTNQRFEPLVPGITFFLSDAWSSGDPLLTWGNFKTIGRQPMLGAISQNWKGSLPNWERPRHGGGKGKTFLDTYMELIPECIVVEAEPVGYPRAPVSKKRVWIDVRNNMYVSSITYDRRGEVWKSFETGSGQFVDGNAVFKDTSGHPAWSWTHVLVHDIQSNRMSILAHVREVKGGYQTTFNMDGDVVNKFFTVQAMQRLGAA